MKWRYLGPTPKGSESRSGMHLGACSCLWQWSQVTLTEGLWGASEEILTLPPLGWLPSPSHLLQHVTVQGHCLCLCSASDGLLSLERPSLPSGPPKPPRQWAAAASAFTYNVDVSSYFVFWSVSLPSSLWNWDLGVMPGSCLPSSHSAPS